MPLDARLAELNRTLCGKVKSSELAVLQRAAMLVRKSGILERSLQEGETAPNIEISGEGGDTTLYQLLERGPVVLNFYRGSWCAFCRAELQAFEQVLPELKALKATYLAISPQGLSGGDSPDCCIVKDLDNRIARAFGIQYTLSADNRALLESWGLDLSKLHGCERVELPLPATYVIGRDRTVVFRYVDVDFRKRFDPQQLVEILRGL